MDGGAWWAAVHGVAKSRIRLSDFTFTFHFHALEKEMATHSSVLAWRVPGMGELGGLPSMGSHRVGHNWSDLAAAFLNCFSGHLKYWLALRIRRTIFYCISQIYSTTAIFGSNIQGRGYQLAVHGSNLANRCRDFLASALLLLKVSSTQV